MNATLFPQPPNLPGFTWRPAVIADAPALHRLWVAIDAADDRQWAGTLHEAEQLFTDSDTHPPTDTLIAVASDGEIIASAWVFTPVMAEEKWRSFLRGNVRPDYRGRGLGAFVLSWMEARGRQILAARPGDLPRLLRSFCQTTEHDRQALLEQHGFRPMRYFFEMTRDLSQPIPEPALPADIDLIPWTPDYDDRAFAAFNEAFRDHWGFEPIGKDDWNKWVIGNESFRRDLSFVVVAGDEVAGIAFNVIEEEVNARSGRNEGWVADLAVRRPWRKRGLATALLNRSMRAFREAGLSFASLGVDAENPTGALSVYEHVGFVAFKTNISYGKFVDGPTPAAVAPEVTLVTAAVTA